MCMRFIISHPHQLVSNLPQCNRAVIVAAAATSLTRYGFFTSSINASSSSLSSFTTRYVNESERVFHMKRNRNTTAYVSYGGLQAAYIKNCGLVAESYQMVEEMNHDHDDDDEYSQPFFPWDDLLREYIKKKWLIQARHFFDHIMPQISTVSWHVLIQGYIMTGQMHQARTLFDSSPKAGTVWESMICGYARHDMEKQAVDIFNSRVQINKLTCQMLIAGFFLCYNLGGGESTFVPRGGHLATWNLLIEGYAYYYSMEAKDIFEIMDNFFWHIHKNAVSWNFMIALFKHREHFQFTRQCYATEPFWKMPKALRNSRSWNLIMAARSTGVTREPAIYNKKLEQTLSIFHVHMPENQKNAASWNTLIYAYLRRGMIDEARSLFGYMPEKNPHSWGLMIAGYLENGMFDEAKEMFFDKSIRVYDDLHSWVLILVWFVKEKMIDEGRRFVIDNVPKRPLAFYSIACACRKHEFIEEAELVLEAMQETMGTNLDIHQTMTFVEENLKDIGGCPRGQDGPVSGVFMQILDPEVDSHGEYSEVFLKGAWDCCGVLQV